MLKWHICRLRLRSENTSFLMIYYWYYYKISFGDEKMIIKNYYVKNDLDHVINYIIRYLIKNNINYLYIKETNELHFDNYILRFKNNKELKELIFDEFLSIIGSLYDTSYNEYFDFKDFTSNNNYTKSNFKKIKNISNIKIDTKGKVKKLNKKYIPTRKIYK